MLILTSYSTCGQYLGGEEDDGWMFSVCMIFLFLLEEEINELHEKKTSFRLTFIR